MMYSNRNFIQEVRYRFNTDGMHVQLIIINTIVFLFLALLSVFNRLIGLNQIPIDRILTDIFTLHPSLHLFLKKPWGLFTSIFSHFDFFHWLGNMVFLYFSGKLIDQFWGGRKLFTLYLLGGLMGGLFEIGASTFLFTKESHTIVGASGAIMAIFIGLAFYKPMLEVALFGVIKFPIYILAFLYVIYEFIHIGISDGTAHFAHIGGIITGYYASKNHANSNSLFGAIEKIIIRMMNVFDKSKKTNFVIKKGGRPLSDEEFILQKKQNQAQIDLILDKIAKSGYESLSKSDKEFLFNQSKK
jgi:membrane associated rhomboid family serine protease